VTVALGLQHLWCEP